jgi:adenine deaminase
LHLPAGSPDTLKLVVIERHNSSFTRAATALASGIGLHKGALGTTFLHDAHNLIVAGVMDSDIILCAETIAHMGGGIALVADGEVLARLPLPVAGLMSPLHPLEVAKLQRALEGEAQKLGCILPHPLTTLAFLGLTVIPSLKLTPEGLFDVVKFQRVTA